MYAFNEVMETSKLATASVEAWLRSKPETVNVRNVEMEPAFQRIDVDLIWILQDHYSKVEVKGDRWHNSGNFFFETHSNKEKGTPGCFLYTKADWLFYYFIRPRILYMLPVIVTRSWFVANIDRFSERSTKTRVEDIYYTEGICYTTVGRLVRIATVMAEVPGVRKEQL